MPETYWDKSGRTDPCNQVPVAEKVILRAGRSNFPLDDRSSDAVYGIVALRDGIPCQLGRRPPCDNRQLSCACAVRRWSDPVAVRPSAISHFGHPQATKEI
jgi:hypothetical protein